MKGSFIFQKHDEKLLNVWQLADGLTGPLFCMSLLDFHLVLRHKEIYNIDNKGIILCVCPTNERCNNIKPSVIGWANLQSDPW